MSAPALTGVSHIALTVTDLQRSVAWYVGTLGFAELFPLTGLDHTGFSVGSVEEADPDGIALELYVQTALPS